MRPESIQLWRAGSNGPGDLDARFEGHIHNRIYLGDHAAFAIATQALGDILVRAPEHSTALTEHFAPGDAVVLVSDGLIEARTAEERPLGYQGLLQVVGKARAERPEDWLARIWEAITGQSGTDRDDATMIVVQRGDRQGDKVTR